MDYARLGSSSLCVSKVILGTALYGSSKFQAFLLADEEALPLLEYAWHKGIRTWDTADVDSHGCTEEIIGIAIKKFSLPRDSLVLMTKIFYAIDPTTQPPISQSLPNRVELSRKHIMSAVSECCARFGAFIDVLQIHRYDENTPMEETMEALHDVVMSGQVRYISANSMPAWQFRNLQNVAKQNGWTKFISIQGYYDLVYYEEEREMIPYCRSIGVGPCPWSSLAKGLPSTPRADRSAKRDQTDTLLETVVRGKGMRYVDQAIVNRVQEVAAKKDVSMTTVSPT